ncbi:hypothetical protein HB364_13845 [Pseudoflavitalea sp. X16]|uniref:hypothetical protein n=1 Tax=Paraflavitalea devenefica TaxID=2716334 RepID=UPI00141DBDF9|nr:hypothetical protein [Paraflavitalea devenefica]NII26171.1 hypothetical protein [Paraflavitalea devenefica]
MDHQFISTPPDLLKQGPIDYLPFHLQRTQLDPASGTETSATRFAYFTLKECLCELLQTPLASLDPNTANFTKLRRYQRVDIKDAGDLKRASLVAIRPGLPYEFEAAPGIYLFISRYLGGLDQVRQITGMPFPDADTLEKPYLIPLASYHPNYTAIEVTREYLDLYHFAQIYRQQLHQQRTSFTHQLVFKGEVRPTDAAPHDPYSKPYHLLKHYYDNLHEPVKALLSTNLYLYDPFCVSNTVADIHHHAFVKDNNNCCLARIKVIPIDQAISGPPFAGIYLQAHPDIATLETIAQLRFHTPVENMGSDAELLLAAYHYNQGYRMAFNKHTGEGEAQFHFDVSGNSLPNSPYTVGLFYLSDDDRYLQQRYGLVNEHYHFSDIRKALQWLLHTDYALLSDTPQPRQMLGYNLSAAGIYDDQPGPIVSLRRVAHHPSHTESGVILLHFHRPGQLPPDVISAIAALEGSSQPLKGGQDGEFYFVLGHRDPTGINVLHNHILNAMERICALPEQIAMVPEVTNVATKSQSNPSDKFTIELQWRLPISSQHESQPPPEELTVTGLDSAHQVLLALDKEIIQVAELWPDTIWLERARLLHGEAKAEIASRYYQSGERTDELPGHFITYNLAHPLGEKLALAQQHLDMVLIPANPHTVTYMLSPPLTLPAPARHPRVMGPPPDPDSPGPKL